MHKTNSYARHNVKVDDKCIRYIKNLYEEPYAKIIRVWFCERQ